MSPKDLLMWRLEKDPQVQPIMVLLMVLDGRVDLPALHAWHRHAAQAVPRLAARVVSARNPFASPRWVPDPLFDPSRHIRRVSLEGKGTTADLLELAELLTPVPFVPRRPPWEAYLIDGLEEGRTAYLLKISHAIVDGTRLREMFLRQPFAEAAGPVAVVPSGRAEANGTGRSRVPRGSSRLRRGTTALRFGAEITRQLADPPRRPEAAGDGVSRRYMSLSVPIPLLRAAGRSGGGGDQEALVAAMAEGCHRYYRHWGIDRPVLRTLAPYARAPLTRQDPSPVGNHWFLVRMDLPAEAGWAERVQAAQRGAMRAYHRNAPDWMGAAAQAIRVAPGDWFPKAFGRFCGSCDFITTTVPGPKRAAALAGVPVREVHGIGPTLGGAVTATTVSYAGKYNITLSVDPAVVPDPEQLARCITESVAEAVGRENMSVTATGDHEHASPAAPATDG
jgi:WS/DGAT/MGAT family acyltransferase